MRVCIEYGVSLVAIPDFEGKVDLGSLTRAAGIVMCVVHTRARHTEESARALTRRKRKLVLHPVASSNRNLPTGFTISVALVFLNFQLNVPYLSPPKG